MSRRKQEGASLQTIYNSDESRRVCLVKNLDGTFGFLEWIFVEAEGGYWSPTEIGAGSRLANAEGALREAEGRVPWLHDVLSAPAFFQLGWATLPGLRGLAVSDFRATRIDRPDNERGVALQFASAADREEFLRQAESEFSSRRFTNAADAFDTVKAWVLQHHPLRPSDSSIAQAPQWPVRILKSDSENLLKAKDEEFAYWQSRTPLERLVAMRELSLALFEESSDEVETRQQFLRSPVCLRRS